MQRTTLNTYTTRKARKALALRKAQRQGQWQGLALLALGLGLLACLPLLPLAVAYVVGMLGAMPWPAALALPACASALVACLLTR